MRGVFLISNYLWSGCLLSHKGLLPDAKTFSWKSGVQHYVRENQAVMWNSQESHAKIHKWHQQTTAEQTQRLFFNTFSESLKSHKKTTVPTALWPLESIALCVTSLRGYALFGDICISSFFCSFLRHDTSRNKLNDSQSAYLLTYFICCV